MFEDFIDERIDVGPAHLRVRHSRSGGPPLLLLHGHPRTSATWHRVAPRLVAAGYDVVCPDLRGDGRSGKPPTTADHAPYAKRAMAVDMLELMRTLGHRSFAVAGHDRGSYVALRLALDHPEAVSALAVLDSVPIAEALDRCDAAFASAWWHWFFLAQPDRPERVINADPDAWYRASPAEEARMGAENYAEWREAIHDPATVLGMLEDYRAGLGVDRDHDEADRAAGRRVACPLLVLWSLRDDLEQLYGDPLEVWRDWASDLRGGHGIDSGHHMAEDAPAELADALTRFLGALRPSGP